MIVDCGFHTPTDITPEKAEQFLRGLRQRNKSARTVNTYLIAFKTFCNWLKENGRLACDPLQRLTRLNEAADRRYERRSMADDEIIRLFGFCEQAEVQHGLTGHERRLVYQLAIEAGLRWNDVRTLCRKDFSFGRAPTVTVWAENAKNSKTDIRPLSPELSSLLMGYFQRNPALPTARAFSGMWLREGGAMLAQDLTAAGIEVRNSSDEVVDFHSLRHTCGTRMAKSGVQPQVAMRIMRHSSMDLTLRYYTHLSLEDKASALSKLPGLTASEVYQRTGTDDLSLSTSSVIVDSETGSNRGQNGGILSHCESHFNPHSIPDDDVANKKMQALN